MNFNALSQKAMDWLRITAGTVLMIGLAIGVILLLAAAAPQETAYSQDYYTVTESSGGEPVLVAYETTTRVSDDAETADRKERIDELDRVAACANARLDGYIQDNSKEQVESANLQEVVITCETSDVKLDNVETSEGLK